MATFQQIEEILAGFIRDAMYPAGATQSTVPGYAGTVDVFEEYPLSQELDAIIKSGSVAVSVTSMGDSVATKRYPVVDETVSKPASPVSAIINENLVTFSGTVAPPLNLALILNGHDSFVEAVQAGDILTDVVDRIAGQVTSPYTAIASGAMIILSGPVSTVEARAGVYAQTRKEVGRQRSHVRVTVWAQDEDVRDGAVQVVRGALEDKRRFTDYDGWGCNIFAGREISIPDALRVGWSRSEIFYPVEFGITIGNTFPTVVAVTLAFDGAGANAPFLWIGIDASPQIGAGAIDVASDPIVVSAS